MLPHLIDNRVVEAAEGGVGLARVVRPRVLHDGDRRAALEVAGMLLVNEVLGGIRLNQVVVVALRPERPDERRARVERRGLRVEPEKGQSPLKSEISTCHPPTFQKSQPLTPMTPLPGVRLRSAILRDASAHRSAKSRDFTISAS